MTAPPVAHRDIIVRRKRSLPAREASTVTLDEALKWCDVFPVVAGALGRGRRSGRFAHLSQRPLLDLQQPAVADHQLLILEPDEMLRLLRGIPDLRRKCSKAPAMWARVNWAGRARRGPRKRSAPTPGSCASSRREGVSSGHED